MFTAIKCEVVNNCYIWPVRRGWLCGRSHGAVVADDTGELLAVSPFSTPPASPAQPAANCNNSITTQSSLMKLSVIVFTAQNCELQTQDTSLPCAVWGLLWGACHRFQSMLDYALFGSCFYEHMNNSRGNWMLGFK